MWVRDGGSEVGLSVVRVSVVGEGMMAGRNEEEVESVDERDASLDLRVQFDDARYLCPTTKRTS